MHLKAFPLQNIIACTYKYLEIAVLIINSSEFAFACKT